MKNLLVGISMLSQVILPVQATAITYVAPIAEGEIIKNQPEETVLAKENLDLTNRVPNVPEINDGFRDNILLILHYLKGDASNFIKNGEVDWQGVRENFNLEIKLNPGETFAFHDQFLPEYQDKVKVSIPVKYTASEGFKVVDGLYGNGVCHLATLINWVSINANLKTLAPTNHDFFPVPGTPQQYGVSIYYTGDEALRQNLYVTNTKDFPITLKFSASSKNVELKIIEE